MIPSLKTSIALALSFALTVRADSDDPPKVLVLTHAVMGSIAFLALFPIGGILIRMTDFKNLIWVHAAIQILAVSVFAVNFGIGVFIATKEKKLAGYHPIIGIILFGVLFIQPFTGFIHHRVYKRKEKRTLATREHIWTGRTALVLGMINGGLGFMFAQDTPNSKIVPYSVVAGIMGVAYIASIIYGEKKIHEDSDDEAKVEKNDLAPQESDDSYSTEKNAVIPKENDDSHAAKI